jgi:ABC-2 type transport system ATP-binding protein
MIERYMPLLQTVALTKDYGNFRALDDLNLTVAPGEIVGVLGPNGSGKSTALRMLLGFLRPTSGTAILAGFDCWSDSVEVRKRVTYLPGELRLYETMTGRQLLQFLNKLRQAPLSADPATLARRLDIDLDKPLVQMSSGMKRKVALMAVLLPKVDLVILDEPTNTLDPTMRDELLEQLRHARDRGQAVLFSSHVLAEVEHVCDRVAILQIGKLVHLQIMSEMTARRIQLKFARLPDKWPEAFGPMPKPAPDRSLSFEYSGEIRPLLEWLSGQALDDVRIEPAGLSPIYHKYHGSVS